MYHMHTVWMHRGCGISEVITCAYITQCYVAQGCISHVPDTLLEDAVLTL